MMATATERLQLIAPQFNVRTNWLSLDTALITGNVISVTVNGQTAAATYSGSSDDTLDQLVTNLIALPYVGSAERSGLVITVTTVRLEILLSATVTGGASQAVVTIGEVDTFLRDAFLALAKTLTSSVWFRGNYDYALALRTAHLMTLDAQVTEDINDTASVGNGSVKAVKQGDLAITYGATSDINNKWSEVKADLSRTRYGVSLISLKSTSNFGMMSTGSMSL